MMAATDAVAADRRHRRQVAHAALCSAMAENRLDDAETHIAELATVIGRSFDDDDDILTLRVIVALARGDRARETLQFLNAKGEDRLPELRVMCLRLLDDPLWEGIAEDVSRNSPDPAVRGAMHTLLGNKEEARSDFEAAGLS